MTIIMCGVMKNVGIAYVILPVIDGIESMVIGL